MRTDGFARALGWVSLALGAAQLTAPRAISRLSGVDDHPAAARITKLVGGRELMHAALMLGGRQPARWAWSRVAGDAMDLALLGTALTGRSGGRRRRVAAATAAVTGITALDVLCAVRGSRARRGPLKLRASIMINRPRDEVYLFWRDLENLPTFMTHLKSVQVRSERRSRWTAKGPAADLVWEAEILDERAGEVIVWGSVRGSDVTTSGSVSFIDGPNGHGTRVDVTTQYGMPGRTLGAAIARMLGEHPEQQIRDDLRRFKQVMETGEVLRSDASPEGTHTLRQLGQRPAQPVGGRS
ncbi:SRPBCC family protein [Nonomuraea sp. LPB2021202275-12-8]|uniref:SRPBCC family protein n=1 Tax=Nonomuraea sp. LPB2021202275-12-8 TaxID=3120159 RepID=UPI00300D2485